MKRRIIGNQEELKRGVRRAEGFRYLISNAPWRSLFSGEWEDFMTKAFGLVSDEFFILPASSSGRYHPQYALGEGGLQRHTKAAMLIAFELFKIHEEFEEDESKRIILAALALHDTCKPNRLHPIMVNLALEPLRDEYGVMLDEIIPLIESHMGQWNLEGRLPFPKTPWQKFVHLCDYLASRKGLEVDVSRVE